VLSLSEPKKLLRVVWLAAIVFVIIISLLPRTARPIEYLDSLPISDKLEHCAAYAVLAFLPTIHERKGFIIAAGIGAVALGVGLEFGQRALGWRDFEIGDMVADAIGVCIGIAAGIPLRATERVRSVFLREVNR
jgi:VanZ family protein